MSKDLKEGLIDKICNYREDTALYCDKAQGKFEIAHKEFLVYLGHIERGYSDRVYKCRSREEAYHLLDRYYKDIQAKAKAYDENNELDFHRMEEDYNERIQSRKVPFEWDYCSLDELNSSDLLHLLVALEKTFQEREKYERRQLNEMRARGI